MNTQPNNPNDEGGGPPQLPPHDELDLLLRQWHAANADKAAQGRDRLMAALSHEDRLRDGEVLGRIEPKPETSESQRPSAVVGGFRRFIMNRYSPLAAAAILLVAALPFILTGKGGLVGTTLAKESTNIVMAPEGGRLDAFDQNGNALGPCTLRHTDVKAEISGRFTRVTVKQQYHNTNPDKIEAVYSFPLSDRSGVDRMTMTIGERVIVGEVKERQQARRVYEQAKQSGRVASLLEQERPNIFTQSIANLEPGATIDIEISYVEMVAEHDGEFSFAFPTVVSPRYIPGNAEYRRERAEPLPLGYRARRGLILAAPGIVSNATIRDNALGERSSDDLQRMLASATPIEAPVFADAAAVPAVWYETTIAYPDGSAEPAIILADRRGAIGGRWFYCPPEPQSATPPGDGFAKPTTQVPDADRITPMPTRPDVRAGHDISISVTMDTGGPGIISLDSAQHKIVREDITKTDRNQPRRVSIALANLAEIPNRDFVLKWKQTAESISSRVFTHTGDTGSFFCVQLDPPAQVKDNRAVPRELVFVVDTSGSMDGRPIALCQEVMRRAIDQMRPQDTFNIITFAGATRIMWDRPRPNTTANRDEAQRFIETWHGSGGTEMMTAIEAALRQGPLTGSAAALTPAQLADLPADGRQVIVEADDSQFRSEGLTPNATTDRATLFIRDDLSILCAPFQLPQAYLNRANQTVADDSITLKLLMRGVWTTADGQRIFQVSSAEMSHDSSVRPLRLVMFLTDAEVGNDMAIIDAVKRNRATTRVFPFGIGTSVNRFLIEQMALAGGGEPEFIYANSASEQQATEAVERFNRRTKTPILTDISVTFNGVQPLDVLPDPGSIQDLYDNRPLTLMGRYQGSGTGTITFRGQSSTGRWENTIPIDFPARQIENSSLPTLWARAKIDSIMAQDLVGIQRGQPAPDVRAKIITLGETFNVMSQYTSFVAVDKLRVTLDGQPRLLHIPIELPDQTNWSGFFGELPPSDDAGESKMDKGDSDRRDHRLMLKTDVLDRLVASNEVMLRKADEDKNAAAMAEIHAALASGSPPVQLRPQVRGAGPAGGTPTNEGVVNFAAMARIPADPSVSTATSDGKSAPNPSPTPVAATPPAPMPAGAAAMVQKPAEASKARPAAVTNAPLTPAATRPLQVDADTSRFESKLSRHPGRIRPPGDDLLDLIDQLPKSQTYTQVPQIDLSSVLQAGGRSGGGQSPFTPGDSQTGFARDNLSAGSRYGLLPWSRNSTEFGVNLLPPGDPQGSVGLDSLADGRLLMGDVDHSLHAYFLATEESKLKSTDGAAAADRLTKMMASAKNSSNKPYLRGDLASYADNELGRRLDPVQQNLLVVAAAQLAESGRILEAKRLLCSNVSSEPGNAPQSGTAGAVTQEAAPAPAERLCGVLNSTLPDSQRLAAVREAAKAAADDLLERRRASTLLRKLAPDVMIQTPTAERYRAAAVKVEGEITKEEKREQSEQIVRKSGIISPGSIMLTILLADTSTKTLDALKALGLKIEAVRPEASVVIARVPLEKLEELTLMDIVKRIELVPMDGTTVR